MTTADARAVRIRAGRSELAGTLDLPDGAAGIVLFAHGSGSSRHSPRNAFVARILRGAGIGTLLFDLLTPQEAAVDAVTGAHRFDIDLLTDRLVLATQSIRGRCDRIGYFGASTGTAAALMAAVELGDIVSAIVSRGGRPDLAAAALPHVRAPTLLIVGGSDDVVIELNEIALARLRTTKELAIVPGASHLFEEPGTLEQAATLASHWFVRHFAVVDAP